MLTFRRLILRNLAYHWLGNFAVLLGVAVGSAVLTGALLVGDSLRGSLRARIERQLAGIDAAAMLHRPVPADIATGLPGHTAAVLLLPGSLQVASDDPAAPSLGRITVLGVNDWFKPAGVPDGAVDWNSNGKQVVVSHRIAAKLGLTAGDKVKLGVERFSDIPRASLFAKRSLDDSLVTATLTIAAVLPADAVGNDFNLTPNPAAPLNLFVPLRTLSDLVQNEPGETKSFPPKATTFLSSGATVAELNAALKAKLTVADFGLKVRVPQRVIDRKQREPRGYVSIESEQLVMDDATAAAVERIAANLGMRAERTIVYLINSISHDKAEIPYSIVAGVNPSAAPPLGPFQTAKGVVPGDNEIVLLDWPDSPLRGLKDDGSIRLSLAYFNAEVEGEGKLETKSLVFRGYIPFAGAADDRDLTPAVKGMTDESVNPLNWNRPPQLDNKKVREKIKSGDINERFWDKYHATPKAYVNLATAKELFGSRYGSVTSIRIAPAAGETPQAAAERLRAALAKELDPASAGLAFDPIRERLLTASHGGTDFGGLFLGFSLFLIAAALMLVGLLFRLALDRRAKEVGLLLATGFAVRDIRRLLLAEGLVLTAIGAVIGLGIGIGYNRLLLLVLVQLWPDKDVGNILRPHVTSTSFIVGFGLTLAMALCALWFSIRGLVKVSPPALLRGETLIATTVVKSESRIAWWLVVCSLPLGIGLIVAGKFIGNPDYQAMTFFGGGGLLLTAGLALPWVWMKRSRHAVVNGRGLPALAQLGGRNAARNPTRSLLTAALLASAAFLLVAVESFRRQPGNEFLDKFGGSGGFNLIAETDVPMFQSFDKGPGRDDLENRLQEAFGGSSHNPEFVATLPELERLEVYPLRLRDGDDASCMNLFQVTRPRVLGVPDSLIERGGFKFYETEAVTSAEKENPWLLLKKTLPGGAIPVFCEQNTAQWMLKIAVGGEIKMPGDDGGEVTLRIVGTFADSPFQSELLMSDAAFAQAFPKTGGYRVFLVRTPPGQEEAVGRVLATGLRANGLIATPTRERVAAYQAVIGAYLSTFQLLGGLGLLLGVMGLAVVVLRSVWERVGELALLRAVGYRTRELQFLVLAENALLLIAGLGIGVLAALASVAPHIAEGATVPWARLCGLLALVFVVGLGVALAATAGILRVPVIPALRRE
jgi:ABC-type antimicrobial peptide transport system permease subunit